MKLIEENELPGSYNLFWRKEKLRVVYTSRQKTLPPTRIWKEQVVRVLHRKVVSTTYGARNLVLKHRREENIGRVVLKTWTSCTLGACLAEKVG